MKKILLVLLSSLTFMLAACGGGGSSSESSSGSGTQFFGAQTITVLGTSSDSEFVMTIDGATATINDEDFTASGAINGNSFAVNAPPLTFTDDGFTCVIDVTYNGSLVSDTRVEGTISGTAVCEGISFPVSGSFAANS